MESEDQLSETGGDSSNDVPCVGSDDQKVRWLVEDACVRFHQDLRAFLLGVLKNSALADDALQRTAVQAIQSFRSVRVETVRGWLFRIALNEARQLQRANRRDQLVQQKFAEQVSEAQSSYAIQRNDWWTESGVLLEGLGDKVQSSLAKLPDEQRTVIQKRIYDGLTFAEIAQQMGQPLGTVLTWMRRGLSRLREDSGLRDLWAE